ncbi:DUF1572 domain-containing protein [Chryseobacterium sp. SNU WT5]|uniref:DUF1572 family protein n=1 Tax=Chryseobacterium sp. SNU WT5 TaxID=2594269 RepID=UPI00117E9EC8|nr:DUF1572 family protein [Chryseobacterium sp. SNU WT5]QDP84296.1 DUF1572 domain-containing protein [Chryseobacterium sp. SNU WT5]
MKEVFIKRFKYYKDLGDESFKQVTEEQLFWQFNAESNSIATLVKHLSGNMESRWTNFRTEDGEKSWRNRDAEFENDLGSREKLLARWEKGWLVLFDALNTINDDDWDEPILIRGEKHSVLDAVLRQLAHYPYHVGQIVYIAKMLKNEDWKTLSIAKNQSANFNSEFLKKQQAAEIRENSSPVCFAKSDEIRDDYKI